MRRTTLIALLLALLVGAPASAPAADPAEGGSGVEELWQQYPLEKQAPAAGQRTPSPSPVRPSAGTPSEGGGATAWIIAAIIAALLAAFLAVMLRRRLTRVRRRPGLAEPAPPSTGVRRAERPRTSPSVPRRGMLAFTPEEAGLRVTPPPGNRARRSA